MSNQRQAPDYEGFRTDERVSSEEEIALRLPFSAKRRPSSRAHAAWRTAADQVWSGWETLTRATPAARASAHAAYVAAPDRGAAPCQRLAEVYAHRRPRAGGHECSPRRPDSDAVTRRLRAAR